MASRRILIIQGHPDGAHDAFRRALGDRRGSGASATHGMRRVGVTRLWPAAFEPLDTRCA